MNADWIADILDREFPEPEVPLWHTSAYTLLIAVLLSARCTDAKVNEIAPQLFALAETPEQMVLLEPEEIEEIIRPCGLARQKARAIWDLSLQLVEKYGGEVPRSFKALESLPGIGHKSASVVMSQAFHEPAFPVDTHIHRSAQRWKLSTGKNVKQTEADLKRLFPKQEWNKVHLQIIHFARRYCPARGHNAEKCPICKEFLAHDPQ